MIHRMHLQPAPFAAIARGQKTIELRLYDEKRRLIRVDDEILFSEETRPERVLRARVTELHRFADFEQLYRTLPLTACGYDESQLSSARASDMERYYSADMQKRYGVVGIEFTLISPSDSTDN